MMSAISGLKTLFISAKELQETSFVWCQWTVYDGDWDAKMRIAKLRFLQRKRIIADEERNVHNRQRQEQNGLQTD